MEPWNVTALLPLLLCCVLVHVEAQCGLTRQMIEGTTRVFLVRGPQNRLIIKRTQISAANEVLHLYCTPTDSRTTTCAANRQFQPALPMTCRTPPMAIVDQISGSCRGTLYRVGHRINNQFMELYRSCFDRSAVRAVWVEYNVFAKPFVPQRRCARFSTDNVISGTDEASYTTRSIYDTFRRIFGNSQRYIPNNRDVIINRGHLAASGDFLFGDQICSTFKYVNVVPQFKSITDRNWETIERWVRNSVMGSQFVSVRTGATGVLTLNDGGNRPRQVFLSGTSRNPVPEWIYKIVRNAQNGQITIFLTYNNIFARARPRAPRYCDPINCPIQLPLTAAAGFTYCCAPGNFNP